MKRYMIGLITGFLLVGCISAKIGYKYYGIDAESYGGHLLGPKPSDDILFSVCKPDDQVKGKCVVLLVDEFQAMATELIQLRAALKDCQKQCAVNH